MSGRRLITAALLDERGRIVELSGPGWRASAADVLADIQFAWNSYSLDVGRERVDVDIAFSITGNYLTAAGAPLESLLPGAPDGGR